VARGPYVEHSCSIRYNDFVFDKRVAGCDDVGQGGGGKGERNLYSKTTGHVESILLDDGSVLWAADGSAGREWISRRPALGHIRNAGHDKHGAVIVHG